jgi:hypothetical protein
VRQVYNCRYSASLSLLREAGENLGVAESLCSLGNLATRKPDYAAAHSLHQESLLLRRAGSHPIGIACSLEGFALLASARGERERAACLWGAAEALRARIGAPLWPAQHRYYAPVLARLHTEMGEAAFLRAWEQGRAMDLEQASEYALQSHP